MRFLDMTNLTYNRMLYEERLPSYPYVYPTHARVLCPAEFRRKFPRINFCRIPIQEFATWMFETKKDLSVFRGWAISKGVSQYECYQRKNSEVVGSR